MYLNAYPNGANLPTYPNCMNLPTLGRYHTFVGRYRRLMKRLHQKILSFDVTSGQSYKVLYDRNLRL